MKQRKTLLEKLYKCVYKDRIHVMKPIHEVIQLTGSKIWTPISKFKIEGIIQSLFSDPYLMENSNTLFQDKYYINPNLIESVP